MPSASEAAAAEATVCLLMALTRWRALVGHDRPISALPESKGELMTARGLLENIPPVLFACAAQFC